MERIQFSSPRGKHSARADLRAEGREQESRTKREGGENCKSHKKCHITFTTK